MEMDMKMDTDVPVTMECESNVSVEIELRNYAAQIYLPQAGARGSLLDLNLTIMEAALLADPESESLPMQWLGGDFDSMVVHCDDLKGGEAVLTVANFQRFRKSLR